MDKPQEEGSEGVQLARGTILDDQTFTFPTNKPKKADVASIGEAAKPLAAMNHLQMSSDTPLCGNDITWPVEYLYDHLPIEAQDLVEWLMPLSPEVFSVADEDAMGFFKKKLSRKEDMDVFFAGIRSHEYLFLPSELEGGHFVTFVAHLTRSSPDDEGYYDTIDECAIINPKPKDRQNENLSEKFQGQLVDHIYARMEMLLGLGNIQFTAETRRRDVWVAPQADGWCSGLRCFAAIRQFFERIVSSTCAGRRFDPNTFWAPMSGWVFPDQVRDEMTAAAAFQARKYAAGLPRLALAYAKGPAPSRDALDDLLPGGGYAIHHHTVAPRAETKVASPESPRGAEREMSGDPSLEDEATEQPVTELQAKKAKGGRRVPFPARPRA